MKLNGSAQLKPTQKGEKDLASSIQDSDIHEFIYGKLSEFTENAEVMTQVTPSTNLLEVGLDSVGLVRLIITIEQQFGIMFEDWEIIEENFQTIHLMTEQIQGKLKAGV